VLAYRLLQGVIGLTRKYPSEVVDRACGIALDHDAFRYRTLVQLCKRLERPQRSLFTADHELIRPLSDYSRILNPGDSS
jgi:hypothetical protein